MFLPCSSGCCDKLKVKTYLKGLVCFVFPWQEVPQLRSLLYD